MSGIKRTFIVAIGVVCMALSAAAAELPFGPMEDVASSYDGPTGLAVGDINADGMSDVVICSGLEGTVRVEFQTESTGFSVYTNIVSGMHAPYVVAIGDIDRDGDEDVVVGQNLISVEAELFWVENPLNGGGGWTAHVVTNMTNGSVTDIELDDFNGDGDLDIAYTVNATGGGTSGISIAWNDGTPVGDPFWATSVVEALANAPSSLALADLDDDGDQDIVAVDRTDDWVQAFLNPGTAPGLWSSEIINVALDAPVGVATGDFDRDGHQDVAVAAELDDVIVWFENDGSWTAHSVAGSWNGASTVSTADMDGDGDDDLVASSMSLGDVAWFENDGTEGWPLHQVDSTSDGAIAAVAGDLDTDGDLDIVAAAHFDDVVGWWPNEQIHRRFAEFGSSVIDDGLGNPQVAAVGDINNDGLNDVVYSEREGDRIAVRLSISTTGNVWMDNEVATGFDGARDVAIADINNDGALDIVGTAVTDDEVAWWENNGAGVPIWTKHTVTAGLDGAHSVVAADFDGDGDLDIAAAGRFEDEVQWFTNANGLGTSWGIPSSWIITSIDGPYELVSGDLNNDGYPDLALTAYEGDAVKAFLYDPATNGFDEYTLAIMADGARGLDLADLDGDGDLDAVATIAFDDQVRWWANDGTGEIWLGSTIDGTFDSGTGVTAADLDGDGDTDVVATSQSADRVSSWVNTGDGSSWSAELVWDASLDMAWSVTAAPIDDDGDLDLVVTAVGTADSVTWYSNLGGQFAANAYPQNTDVILDADLEPVLYVTLHHLGRPDHDAPLEFSGITLSFTDSTGTPLTTTEAESLISNVSFFRDYGAMSFDPLEDEMFFNISALPLSSGTITVPISDGLVHARVQPENWGGFWVVIWSTSDASLQTPSSIIVSVDEEFVLAEDSDHDLPLLGEPGDVATTGIITFDRALFADDFESGGTGAWSSVTP